MSDMVSALRARALLDGRDDKGAWRAGNIETEGKVWARDPAALPVPTVGDVCIFNANLHRPHTGNRRLAAAAPALARTVIAQAEELDRARAEERDTARAWAARYAALAEDLAEERATVARLMTLLAEYESGEREDLARVTAERDALRLVAEAASKAWPVIAGGVDCDAAMRDADALREALTAAGFALTTEAPDER